MRVTQSPALEELPVSEACPTCGQKTYDSVRPPHQLIALRWNRICKVCGTLYVPPIPQLISLGLTLTGVVLLVIGGVGGFFSLRSGNILALLLEAALCALGVLAVKHGYRSLVQSGSM
ncbi:MAG: hypothetical protein L0Y72_01895 [Gemmataceae bacterium]|nr:hypothetical protein [Gemmataceae bacterium]MCI0737768.1 hypothetical protein [Gemmataceae bacterium]